MAVKTYNGKSVDVNEEGYLTDLSQWDKTVAESIAAEEGIEMTDRHWAVINYLQDQYKMRWPCLSAGSNKAVW